jgi:hypothetical protein
LSASLNSVTLAEIQGPIGSASLKTAHTLQIALLSVRSFLTQLALDEHLFELTFGAAFGIYNSNSELTRTKRRWATGQFDDFPVVEQLPATSLMGAQAAFVRSTGKIYISREFLLNNHGDTAIIASVLLEEYGHYLD